MFTLFCLDGTDDNIIVSAMLRWDSIPGNVMELTFEGAIVPILNTQIVKEYREVLARPKFHFTEEIIRDVLENIQSKEIFNKIYNLALPFIVKMMYDFNINTI